jgi:hypothetical protein
LEENGGECKDFKEQMAKAKGKWLLGLAEELFVLTETCFA